MESTAVLVAGAGPVGTVAACALAALGVEVLLCEAGADCAQDLRASTFHPPTLEMLDQLDIARFVIERGLKAPVYQYRDRHSGERIEFDLSELCDRTRFPFRVQCEQHMLARALARRLDRQANASVLFNHRVTMVEQSDESVTVALETPNAMERISARYVIDAEGANSIIRKWLGVAFEGFTWPEKFLCLSTSFDLQRHIPDLALVNYISDPDQWLVLLRTPRVWRILLPAGEEISDSELLSDQFKQQFFDNLVGDPAVATAHRTVYRVHQRVVARMAHGRVFLVGDAAHLNNPLGGFGMNSGIHDVWNLHEKIAHCLKHGHDAALFERFDRQRRKVTNDLIQTQTIRNKELMEQKGDAEAHRRRFEEMRAVNGNDARRYDFLLRQSMFHGLENANGVS